MQSGVGAVGGWGVEGKEMPGANRAPAESNPSGPKGVDGSRQDLSKRQSGSDGKKICLQCRRLGFDLWVGKIYWKRERLPTPVFCLENSMNYIVHEVSKSRTQLSDFDFQRYDEHSCTCFLVDINTHPINL